MIHHLVLSFSPIFIIFVQIMIGVVFFFLPLSIFRLFLLYKMETIKPRTVGDCG